MKRKTSSKKPMKRAGDQTNRAVQLFDPGSATVYTIEAAERLGHVPRRMIAVYHKYGLVSRVKNLEHDGFLLDGEAIRTLRRIERLRTNYGLNLPGIKMILQLMNEVGRLRTKLLAVGSDDS